MVYTTSDYELMDKAQIAEWGELIQKNAMLQSEHLPIMRASDTSVFYSEEKRQLAVFLFLSSQYNAKDIAKKAYMLDEGDIFVEQMDVGFPLGTFKGVETSVIEILFKVRSCENRYNTYGMPFSLYYVRLAK